MGVITETLNNVITTLNGLLGVIDGKLRNKADKSEVVTPAQLEERLQKLIGAAPELLNEIVEIANALGNDPNFGATMFRALADKADKTSVHTIAQADAKYLQKESQAADAAKLGSKSPEYFAAAAGLSGLEEELATAFSRIATALTNGANQIKATGVTS